MKKAIFLFVFVTLGTFSALAQTSEHRQPLTVQECSGKKYSVVANSELSTSWRNKENWDKLIKENPGILTRWTYKDQYEYLVNIHIGDVVCIPEGTVIADFIVNGDYAPTLVPYKAGVTIPPKATTLGGTPYYQHWYDDPYTLFWVFSALGLALVVVIRIHTLRGREKKKPKPYHPPHIRGRY